MRKVWFKTALLHWEKQGTLHRKLHSRPISSCLNQGYFVDVTKISSCQNNLLLQQVGRESDSWGPHS